MTDQRTIDIDFDVHKRIEMARQSFAETPNDVLRRLLGIDNADGADTAGAGALPAAIGNGERAWVGKGVSLPHGTMVRMDYNGRRHEGQIDDGEWLVEGQRFASPSAAASGTARTRAGKRPTLDGWIYWEALIPGEREWTGLKDLRRRSGGPR